MTDSTPLLRNWIQLKSDRHTVDNNIELYMEGHWSLWVFCWIKDLCCFFTECKDSVNVVDIWSWRGVNVPGAVLIYKHLQTLVTKTSPKNLFLTLHVTLTEAVISLTHPCPVSQTEHQCREIRNSGTSTRCYVFLCYDFEIGCGFYLVNVPISIAYHSHFRLNSFRSCTTFNHHVSGQLASLKCEIYK